jgi:hypothetical protein
MKPLEGLRNPLLDVHRALLESERAPGQTPVEFLQALIDDPRLAWLKPLTALVSSLDELLGDPEFQRRYREALQRDPQVAIAHGKLAGTVRP